MSGLFGYFGGRSSASASRDKAKDAIIDLRQHLIMLEKREDHLMKKIGDEEAKAKANVTSNKRVALAALRQKKMYENELDKISGRRMTLETQVNAIENANLNMETMNAMKEGAAVLKRIHNGLTVESVDKTMDSIREQMDIQSEISDAISNPVAMGAEVDEDELQSELQELESNALDERLAGAAAVPAHPVRSPAARLPSAPTAQLDLDEEQELRELQAQLAM